MSSGYDKRQAFSEHSVCNWHIHIKTCTKIRVRQTTSLTRAETFSDILHLSICGLWLFAHAIGRTHVRVVGGLLENQLHVRWIIRLVRQDEARRSRAERPDTRGLAVLRTVIETETTRLHALCKDWRAATSRERGGLSVYNNEPRTLLAFIISGKRDKVSYTRWVCCFSRDNARVVQSTFRRKFYLTSVFV